MGTDAAQDLRIESIAQDHTVAQWRNVIIGMWRAQPKVKGVRECLELATRMHATLPAGHPAFLIIAERKSPPPDADARGLFARMMKEFNGRTRCTAVVAEGGSLFVSVVRGVLTGLLIVTRHDTPTKMFGTAREAVTWLKSELDASRAPSFSVDELDGAVNVLRAQMDALEKKDASSPSSAPRP